MKERKKIEARLKLLNEQEEHSFPPYGQRLDAPSKPGVYIIRDPSSRVMHVGRTVRGRKGLFQRLKNHLDGLTYQYLPVVDDRERVLLEYAATVWHCPLHLGVGAKRSKST